ncbi:MAG: GDSL family lipase [Clostridia bacterium]|nr:GDSL family lipase [Clostridia bacterium]MDE7265731.1 GDSL family lipase [Clostridia bacterium]
MKIVFIGDSITDCGRDRNDEKSLGSGYVKVLSDKLHPLYPDTDLELINKGISGNELGDVLDRLQKDVIDLKPDAVVIMIGINNTLHKYSEGKELDLKKFEQDLISLFDRLKKAGIVAIFLEPFLLPAPDKRRMRKLFEEELKIIDRVAEEHADEFVPYDEMFQGLTESMPYTEYSADGVHPTHRCSRLIANTAIKAIRKHLL